MKQSSTMKVDNGQIILDFNKSMIGKDGCASGHQTGARIQIYWPKVKIMYKAAGERKHSEFYFSADTVFRIVLEKGYFGIGFQLFGFGFAFDYED